MNCQIPRAFYTRILPERQQVTKPAKTTGDLVLQEIWRIKDELSAARGHSVEKLFADLRAHEKLSGHPVVNLQTKRREACPPGD